LRAILEAVIQINDRMFQTGIWVINMPASEACLTHEIAKASAISKQTMRKLAKQIALILLRVAVVARSAFSRPNTVRLQHIHDGELPF
jgi:hypothetical protein